MVVEENSTSNNTNSTDENNISDEATAKWGYDLYITFSYSMSGILVVELRDAIFIVRTLTIKSL